MAPNLLVISVDCMRRDRLSAYGHRRKTTPFLDSMLDRSLHCTSAHSVSSWTCPAVISMLTGLYPTHHGGGIVPGDPKNLSKTNLPTAMPADLPTLPSILGDAGYRSAAVGAVWNAHLPIRDVFARKEMLQKPAASLVTHSMRWIAGGSEPWFLWLHLGDAHEPLRVPRALRGAFGRIPRVPRVRRWDFQERSAPVGSAEFERYRDARERTYDAAILGVDGAIAQLLRALAARRELDRTIVAVTADHGEELWEHRDEEIAGFEDPRNVFGVGHGHNLFQVHTLIPLLFVGPGIGPRAIESNVSLVDLFPTVLEAAGLEPPAPVDGWSLVDAPVPEDRPVPAMGIAYGHEKATVVVGDRKLLSAPGDGYERGFILGLDRRERGPLDGGEVLAELRAVLPAAPSKLGEQVEPTEEIEAHLRDLGYID
jgi:arylsulfatase A-like enzyme